MRGDDELYERVSGRRRNSAYDELMIRHGDDLLIYLNGYTHNFHDAEDLMIEAFARIMVKKAFHMEPATSRAYLFRTGRTLSREISTQDCAGPMFSAWRTWTGKSRTERCLSRIAWDNEKTGILNVCLGRIDPQLREALWLCVRRRNDVRAGS